MLWRSKDASACCLCACAPGNQCQCSCIRISVYRYATGAIRNLAVDDKGRRAVLAQNDAVAALKVTHALPPPKRKAQEICIPACLAAQLYHLQACGHHVLPGVTWWMVHDQHAIRPRFWFEALAHSLSVSAKARTL